MAAGSASLYFLLPRISEENSMGSDTCPPEILWAIRGVSTQSTHQ